MTTITCDAAQALMVRALGDGGGETTPPPLAAHVAGCASCADTWAAQRSVHALLASREPEPMPAGFTARLDAAIDDLQPWWARFDWRWWTLRVAPVTAALLLLAGSSAARGMLTSSSVTSTTPSSTVSTALWDDASTVSNDSLLLAVLSGSPDDTVSRYEGSAR